MNENFIIHPLRPEYHRLQSSGGTGSSAGGETEFDDSQVLRQTFMVYLPILVVVVLLFSLIRRKYRRAFNVRSWLDPIKTPLAYNQYGFFSWFWKLKSISDDKLMDECGMDALCFVRVLRMGFKISLLGVLCSAVLMPLYATADDSQNTRSITDNIAQLTISHVPEGSPRLLGAVIAAWIIFGNTMRLILKEFVWFIEKRHKFLATVRPRNYAVYVRNIPNELRSDAELENFFRQCFQSESILEGNVALKVPELSKLVAQREAAITKFEHAVAVEDRTGEKPQHAPSLASAIRGSLKGGGEKVDSINYFASEIKELNQVISKHIDDLNENKTCFSHDVEQPHASGSNRQISNGVRKTRSDSENERYGNMERTGLLSVSEGRSDHSVEEDCSTSPRNDIDTPNGDPGKIETAENAGYNAYRATNDATPGDSEGKTNPGIVLKNATKKCRESASSIGGAVKDSAKAVAENSTSLLKSAEDGKPESAGFLSFRSLRSTHAALQLIHHGTPFTMEVQEAPAPDDVFWFNVGRGHKELQVGRLMSFAATAVLCLFWTIPVSFVASLSTIESLRAEVGFVDDLLDTLPFLVPFFEIAAPLLLVVVNALLPMILRVFSMMEGPVSGAVVEASLFTKLAAFMIIQTFFVSAISGGLLQELSSLVQSPTSIVDLLSTSLPAQATYFIQIIFVTTVFSCGMEILRVVPLLKAMLRRFLGPRLTERERQQPFLTLRPLSNPLGFEHAGFSSNIVLYYIVFLVYSVISPLTSIVVAFCFAFMDSIFCHQFVYIYPNRSDSGGKLWLNFMRVLIACMFVAEFTIVGLLALKRAPIATPLMVPLIVVTALFSVYINEQHFKVTKNLPSRECTFKDIGHSSTFDSAFLKDAYLQPELQTKEAFPNVSNQRQVQYDLKR